MVKPPLPFILLASMKSTSPPAGVQARPTATPARLVRSAISVSTRTLMPPRNSWMTSGVIDQLLGAAFGDPAAPVLRQTVPICCSSLRTPASRV